MPDSKITALTSIGASTDPANDPLVLVDVSDTSMAATGTTKKVTLNQLLGASGTATLASATITGDLTVDTSTLKVDSANNRVGIGTTSPISLAQLSGATPSLTLSDTTASSGSFFNILFRHTDGLSATYNIATIQGQTNGNGGNGNLIFYTAASNSNTERYKIDSTGVATWSNVGGVAGTAMTLNSTGLGVGVTPSAGDGSGVFKAAGTGSGATNTRVGLDVREITSGNAAGIWLGAMNSENTGVIGSRTASGNIAFQTFNGASWGERMRIDSSGNVGVGVTPSAWFASSYKALQVNTTGVLASFGSGSNQSTRLANNWFSNTSGVDTYITSNFATVYQQNSGQHQWYTAASGTAGNAITFTQAMTLDASGNLLVGTTSQPTGVTGSKGTFKSAASDWTSVVWNSNATPFGLRIQHDTDVNGSSSQFLFCYAGSTTRAEIRSNGGLANYQANNVNLSDARTKTDIKPLASYWNKIKSLELVTFKYKDQTHSDDNIGLIAQQVESVAPELVDVDGFGETPADGVPLKTIYTTDLYHASIKALQEAMARIEALEAKLA
jgi:hypothetical protein